MAQAIETLFPDRLEEFLGLLAYHYTKAEAWEKAQEYLLEAGRQAGRIAADPETLAHFEQALEAHLRAHGGTWGELISDEGIDWFLEWTRVSIGEALASPPREPDKQFYGEVRARLGPQDPQVRSIAIVLANAYLQGDADREAQVLMEAVPAQGDLDGWSDADRLSVYSCLGRAKVRQGVAQAEPTCSGPSTLPEASPIRPRVRRASTPISPRVHVHSCRPLGRSVDRDDRRPGEARA